MLLLLCCDARVLALPLCTIAALVVLWCAVAELVVLSCSVAVAVMVVLKAGLELKRGDVWRGRVSGVMTAGMGMSACTPHRAAWLQMYCRGLEAGVGTLQPGQHRFGNDEVYWVGGWLCCPEDCRAM